MYKGCTRDVQGMYKGCTREQHARNTVATPEQHRSNTLAPRLCRPEAKGGTRDSPHTFCTFHLDPRTVLAHCPGYLGLMNPRRRRAAAANRSESGRFAVQGA